MECVKVKEIIPRYINHSASQEETCTIEEHLCICDSCRQYLGQIIDQPKEVPAKQEYSPHEKKKDLWSYFVLIIGALTLLFFIFLAIKTK